MKVYTPDFRAEVVKYSFEIGNVTKAAKDKGVAKSTLVGWRKEKASSINNFVISNTRETNQPKSAAEIRAILQRRIDLLKVELNTLLETVAYLNSI